MKKISPLLLLSILFASSAQATLLTFDDVPGGSTQNGAAPVPTYLGFNYSSTLNWIDVVGSSWNSGAHSGDFALVNNYGGVGTIVSADASDFSFDGLWAKRWGTSPESGGTFFRIGTIDGFNDGVKVWSIDTAINGSYQFFAGQAQQIDALKLALGNHFLVDDIALNQPILVPEPSTLLLLGLGFLGLGMAKSRRLV